MAGVEKRLPRGRHKIPREDVVASQRERMLDAMTEAVAERGYVATSVADVLVRAQVSRATFYQHFTDKQDCFMAAYEHSVAAMFQALSAGLTAGSGVSAADRIDDTVRAYLTALQDNPAGARTFLVEVYAAGQPALERRAATLERFADAIAAMVGAEDERQRWLVRLWVSGVSSVMTTEISLDRLDEIGDLREQMTDTAKDLLTLLAR
jgi:AcrR family transcriptional regulator